MSGVIGTLACWGLSLFDRYADYICRLPEWVWVPVYRWLYRHDRCAQEVQEILKKEKA